MGSRPTLGLAAAFLAAAPMAAQPVSVRVLPTPPASASLADVQRHYEATERSVETEYAKLIQDAKGQKQALEDKIKSLESQIEKLKQTAKKIELVEHKIQQLLPRILEGVGSDPGAGKGRTPSTAQRDRFTATLAAELAGAGLGASPDDLRKLVDAISQGGPGAMALAVYICISIAEASGDVSISATGRTQARAQLPQTPAAAHQSLLGRQDFPKVTQADLSTAASMPAGGAASYFGSRFSAQAADRLKQTNDALAAAKIAIKDAQGKIAVLQKQIEKLQKDRDRALADLKKQKDKAIAEALKAPAPTPKKS